MSVRILGLNLLNANCYNNITITEDNNNYKVYINRKKKENSLSLEEKTKYTPSFSIEGKTDEQKVINVVSKFLEYATINKITGDYMSYNSKHQAISGTRQMKISLFNPKLRIIPQMILNKYLEDRMRFCGQNKDIKHIIINEKPYSSYDLNEDSIRLDLMKKSSVIEEVEKQFFKEYISEKLNEIGKVATLRYSHTIFVVNNKRILIGYINVVCGNLKIDIEANFELLELIKEIVENYNRELSENKIMQLKMEGF